MLFLDNFSVFIDDVSIVQAVSLNLDKGQMHVCMGPNGSGKSSLAYALAGHPRYKTKGTAQLNGNNLLDLSPDKRAKLGLFLSMQHPQEVPGVTVRMLLKEAFCALYPEQSLKVFEERLKVALELLQFEPLFLARSINEGFSGGEKKRCEMVQLFVLQPKLAILDEIDSGLDVDALKCVGEALHQFKKICPESSLLLITHYQRILKYVEPDVVHVLKGGKLVASGTAHLVHSIQERGYDQFS